MIGDGQVTAHGNTVLKGNARKVRKLSDDKVLVGFAGSTADAFTLVERLEQRLEEYPGMYAEARNVYACSGASIDAATVLCSVQVSCCERVSNWRSSGERIVS